MKLKNASRTFVFFAMVTGTNAWVDQSRVRVIVHDMLGNTIAAGRTVMIGEHSSTEISKDSEFVLDYGQYTLEVSASGAQPLMQSVIINQPQQIINVAMKLAFLEENKPIPCSIVGRVDPPSDLVRMRAFQLFGSDMVDVPVSADGSFQFRNLTCGEHMVIVLTGKRCMGIRLVTARPLSERFEIKIGETNPATCGPMKN